MPVAEGSVEGTPVNVLRDAGRSAIVVRRALVPEDKLTGREERCILIDGTVRYTPVAEIYVETPFFTGITTAVCIKNPLYDLVIGNVPGAQDVSISPHVEQTTQAVQTRSQAKKVTKGFTPLITPLIDLGTEDLYLYPRTTLFVELGSQPSREMTRPTRSREDFCIGLRRTNEDRRQNNWHYQRGYDIG